MVEGKHVYYHWRGRTTKWRNVNTFIIDEVILRGREDINNKTDNCRKWSLRFACRTNVWP